MPRTSALLFLAAVLICRLIIALSLVEASGQSTSSEKLHEPLELEIRNEPLRAKVQIVPFASAKPKIKEEIQSDLIISDEPHVYTQYVTSDPSTTQGAGHRMQYTTSDMQHQSCSSAQCESHPSVFNLLSVVDQKDIRPEDLPLLDKTLKWLPPLCRENLENLVVRYKPKAQRGQATSTTILIRGEMPEEETIAILTHECGHIADLGGLEGSSHSGKSLYPDGHMPTYNDDASVRFYKISWKNSTQRKSDSSNSDFVSGYAVSDPFEDFAESFILYALHNSAFQNMTTTNDALMEKYVFMRDVVFGPDFTPLSSDYDGGGRRVWDVTKLGHGLFKL